MKPSNISNAPVSQAIKPPANQVQKIHKDPEPALISHACLQTARYCLFTKLSLFCKYMLAVGQGTRFRGVVDHNSSCEEEVKLLPYLPKWNIEWGQQRHLVQRLPTDRQIGRQTARYADRQAGRKLDY